MKNFGHPDPAVKLLPIVVSKGCGRDVALEGEVSMLAVAAAPFPEVPAAEVATKVGEPDGIMEELLLPASLAINRTFVGRSGGGLRS